MLVTVLDVLSSKLSTLLGEQLVGLAKVADVVDVGTLNLETQTVGAVRFAKTMGDYNTGNTAAFLR